MAWPFGDYRSAGAYGTLLKAMSGKLVGPPTGPENAQASSIAPGTGAAPRQTPDESTLLLPTPAGPESTLGHESRATAAAQEQDIPRLLPGEALAGRFTILRFIAQGGMGAVYEANDVMLRSGVALKVIRGRIATDANAMERFRREVLLARRVSHPNVCRVYELFEATTADGVPIHFLTMELLEGETLSQRLAREGRLSTTEALPLAQQLCEGLAAAHSQGVIHRDFKSSNVMLVTLGKTSDGVTGSSTRVAITDFGIARAARENSAERREASLTGGAAILGTPEYMAPEQVTGDEVTPATDIYALGVVLYEMVTGKLPFTGDTPLVAAAKRLNEPPPRPEAATPGLDPRWSATILRCLALEPERRFKSPLDILPELERPPRRWPRWASTAAAVLALVLGGGAAVRFLTHAHLLPKPRTAGAVAARPVVAILGFRDEMASPELAWLPTALSEGLEHELAAAETSLRLIPGDRIAAVRRSLGVSEDAVDDGLARQRMQALLAANTLVFGTLKRAVVGSASVGLSVRVVDAVSGRELAAFEEDLGQAANSLTEKVSSLAESLRATLGASLSQEESAALSDSRPRNLTALHSYAAGVLRLRKFESENSRAHFQAALAADGQFLAAQRRLAETWESESNRKQAFEARKAIRSRVTGLTSRQRAEAEAGTLDWVDESLEGSKSFELWKALFDATPDDIETGLKLVNFALASSGTNLSSQMEMTNAIISRLRELPTPASQDIRLELAEANAASYDNNPNHQEQLLTHARARAEAIGGRTEIAHVLDSRAWLLHRLGRTTESAALRLEAARLYEDAGELRQAANQRLWRTLSLSYVSPTNTAINALEENAALQRKLGNHQFLHAVLGQEVWELYLSGDLDRMTARLGEVRTELEAIGQETTTGNYNIEGRMALARADMDGLRTALQKSRAESPNNTLSLVWEATILRAQDHLREARGVLEKLIAQTESRPFKDSYQLDACELLCDEGQPRDGLQCLSEHPPAAGERTTLTVGIGHIRTKCRYLAGDFEGAETAGVDARAAAQQLGMYAEGVLANAYLQRARAARGETGAAMTSLRADLTEAQRRHQTAMAFEVVLALGEVELLAGRPEGRRRLVQLEKDAASKEFFHVARLARDAMEGKPAAPPRRGRPFPSSRRPRDHALDSNSSSIVPPHAPMRGTRLGPRSFGPTRAAGTFLQPES